MIKCSLRPVRFSKGKICISCAKVYCKEEARAHSVCPFCSGELNDAEISEEKLGNISIEWLTLNTARIGLVDFEEVPSFLPRFLDSGIFSEVKAYEIILFPTKKSSIKLMNFFSKKADGRDVEYNQISEKSRYTIVEEPEHGKRYLLLNIGEVTSETLEFLVSFLSNVFSEMEIYRNVGHEKIIDAFGRGLFDYVQRLGIPFITADEETREYFELLFDNLPGFYAEYSALKKVSRNYPKEIPSFIRHKFHLILLGIDYEFLDWFRTIHETLSAFIQLASLLAVAQNNPPLRNYVKSFSDSLIEEAKRRMVEFPDVVDCIEVIIQELSKAKLYLSYDSYLLGVSKVLEKVLKTLTPRYLRISEFRALIDVSHEYEKMIEMGQIPYVPKFGSIDDFCNLLQQVFQREDIFPELRVLAGQVLSNILMFRVWKERSYISYLKGIELVENLANLTVTNVSAIRQRLGRFGIEHGGLGYHDACLTLLSWSQFSNIMNDENTAAKLVEHSRGLAYRYNVLPMKAIHEWKRFLETHDYVRLVSVCEDLSATDYVEHNYLENFLKAISHLGTAILKGKSRKGEFDEAERFALSVIDQDAPMPIPSSFFHQAILSSSAMYHLIHVFKNMLTAKQGKPVNQSALKRALLHSQAMSANLSKIDPMNRFANKTEILYALIKGDFVKTEKMCKLLKDQSLSAPLIRQFAEKVETWVVRSKELTGRRFLIRINFDRVDPWEIVLEKVVADEMYSDLSENIAAADAIVFVEGVSDVAILEKFVEKLEPDKNLLFIDAQGFSNMSYYAQARIAREVGSPLFVLFDGDTLAVPKKRRVKNRLLEQVSLQEDHVLTLNKNSIEDYLLEASAIKRAFPAFTKSVQEIDTFLRQNTSKRNKKKVLETLFRISGVGKYDYEKGVQIVSAMKADEIPEEIRHVVELFSGKCKS